MQTSCYAGELGQTKKLCGSGNPTLPTILVPTLIFLSCKKNIKNRSTVRYS